MIQVGVVFGGASVEHEVSVISGMQMAAALDRRKYTPLPVYISKGGDWFTGENLLDIESFKDLDTVRNESIRVVAARGEFGKLKLLERGVGGLFRRPREWTLDVMLPAMHGGDGENGSLQGMFETLNVPYTGSGVMGSALGMDKVLSKLVCRDRGIPVVDFLAFRESDWGYREDEWLEKCEREIGYPLVVKPSRLGSSIGIVKADDRKELDAAIEDAFRYDEKVIIERAVQQLREVNCAVLGDPDEAKASVLEEPVAADSEALLTFQDKYERGSPSKSGRGRTRKQGDGARGGGMASLDRIIPANLPAKLTEDIQNLAVRIFQLFECSGVARIDFMIDRSTDRVYFNEINTIPGSFSFYLWEPSGVSFDTLGERLIEIALNSHHRKNRKTRSYDTNILATGSLRALKGEKAG